MFLTTGCHVNVLTPPSRVREWPYGMRTCSNTHVLFTHNVFEYTGKREEFNAFFNIKIHLQLRPFVQIVDSYLRIYWWELSIRNYESTGETTCIAQQIHTKRNHSHMAQNKLFGCNTNRVHM